MSDEQEKINEELPGELDIAKAQAEEYKANWQRALADYRNLQKETAAMRSQWAQMSEEQILQNFIPVYENFKKAFSANLPTGDNEKQWQSWKQGIEYIMKQFRDVLKGYNVQEIKTVGEKFDPRLHEAISEEDGADAGVIIKEVEGGYKMGDKVIKPARVVISK
ncbi:MAG: molecular chaperone GrpE [Parcubacteria group bacterium Gr01-1014_13]|nr:MAG: molecular chaperone GrpE [Parcubacteria group bacterium Gr01-1014_13]